MELKKEDKELLERVFSHNDKSALQVCVGSWKAYNDCNDHALGSCYKGNFYIDFEQVADADELDYILDLLGWSEEEKEELFIQDLMSSCGIDFRDCDYINPKSILNKLNDCNIDLSDEEQVKKLAAILEGVTSDFFKACDYIDDYDFCEGITGEEYEEELINDCYDMDFMDGPLGGYISINYEAIARDDDHIIEVGNGILIVR